MNFKKYVKDYKEYIIIAIVAILVYFLSPLFVKTPSMSKEVKSKIDSLTYEINRLKEYQIQYDTILKQEVRDRELLDKRLDTLKVNTTVVRNYYTQVIKEVSSYDTKQVDSFFKSRYGY